MIYVYVRGGSWWLGNSPPLDHASFQLSSQPTTFRARSAGFRCGKSLDEQRRLVRLRGGAWYYRVGAWRAADGLYSHPAYRASGVGFRCVRRPA